MKPLCQIPASIIITVAVSGCQFVQLSGSGARVAQAGSGDVAHCKQVGEVDAQTKAKVLLARGAAKVQEELWVIARNTAADLGANALVAVGTPQNGKQRFLAYQCPTR